MHYAIVYVGIGMYGKPQVHVALAAVASLATGRYHMVFVDTLLSGSLLGYPPGKSGLGGAVGGECSRLVGNLPRHKRGRFGIRAPV